MVAVKEITPKALIERLESGDATIQVVDVREDEEVEMGKIKNAIHIPLTQVPTRTEELDASKTVVTVCRSGRRSERAAEFLESQGYRVLNMDGGMIKWTGEIVSASFSN